MPGLLPRPTFFCRFSINSTSVMKNFLPFLLYFFCAAASVAQPYSFPLKISDTKRYLVDQKGTPFFYNADTGWKLCLKLDKAEVRQYLADRKQKKFNVIQTIITGFAGEQNIYDVKPFADPNDFSTLSEEYFDHVEWVIQQVDSMGLLLSIAPLWAGCCGEGYGGKGAVGPSSIMFRNGPEKTRAFGEYLGKRFARFNNIMWIMGGDIDPYEDRETMDMLARGIKSQAPHQLMTYHASSSHSSSDVWENPNWLDVVMTYTYFRGFNKAWNKEQPDVYEVNFKEYTKSPVKPFFLGESTYEGEHEAWGSAIQIRKQAYWSVLAGGTGNAYGSPMWAFPENWKTFLKLPGGNSLKHYFTLFHERPWYRLIPDPASKIIAEGQGTYAQNNYAIAAADEKGEFIIAYIPSGRTFKISASALRGKNIKASWYSPEDGTWKPGGRFKKDRILSFTSPDQRDWVLVLDSMK